MSSERFYGTKNPERGSVLKLGFLQPGFRADIDLQDGSRLAFTVTDTAVTGAGYQSEQPIVVPRGTLDPSPSDYLGVVSLAGVFPDRVDPGMIDTGRKVQVRQIRSSCMIVSPFESVRVTPGSAKPEIAKEAKQAHRVQMAIVSEIGGLLGLSLGSGFQAQHDTDGLNRFESSGKNFIARYWQRGRNQELTIHEADGYWTKIQYFGGGDWIKVSSSLLLNDISDVPQDQSILPDTDLLLDNNAIIVTATTSGLYSANIIALDIPRRFMVESIIQAYRQSDKCGLYREEMRRRLPNLPRSAQFEIKSDLSGIRLMPDDSFFEAVESIVSGITKKVSESTSISSIFGTERPLVSVNNSELIFVGNPGTVLAKLKDRIRGYMISTSH